MFWRECYRRIDYQILGPKNDSRLAGGYFSRWGLFDPVALFSDQKLFTGSGKLSERISEAAVASSVWKL